MYKWKTQINRTQRKHSTETSGKVTVVTNAEKHFETAMPPGARALKKRKFSRDEINVEEDEERRGLAPRARAPSRSEPARSQLKTLLTLAPNSSVHKHLS